VEREGAVTTGDTVRIIPPPGAVTQRQPVPASAE
jgi:hypothetical protein